MTGVTHLLSRQAKEFWESPGYFAFCAGGVHLDARQSLIKAPLLVFNAASVCYRSGRMWPRHLCRFTGCLQTRKPHLRMTLHWNCIMQAEDI